MAHAGERDTVGPPGPAGGDVSAGDRGERDWVVRISTGDIEAFERLFRKYFGPLCSVVNGYVKAPDVAEDLVQDLLLTVWTERARLDVHSSLRVYLFGAARKRALNSLRRRRLEIAWVSSSATADSATASAPRSAQDTLESEEIEMAVGAAIAALPERRRLAFQLTQQAGLSHAEAASVMGLTPKTVAIHLWLARKDLRERVGPLIER